MVERGKEVVAKTHPLTLNLEPHLSVLLQHVREAPTQPACLIDVAPKIGHILLLCGTVPLHALHLGATHCGCGATHCDRC